MKQSHVEQCLKLFKMSEEEMDIEIIMHNSAMS